MYDGSMTVPYANCKYHDPILIFGYKLFLINVYTSLLCVVSLSIGPSSQTRWLSLSHIRAHGVYSSVISHTLSPKVSFSHTCSRYNPPHSRNNLRLFSLSFITSTLPLTSIHTHNPHRPFLYTYPCLRVSCTHIIFRPVSHALSHTSLPNRRVDRKSVV